MAQAWSLTFCHCKTLRTAVVTQVNLMRVRWALQRQSPTTHLAAPKEIYLWVLTTFSETPSLQATLVPLSPQASPTQRSAMAASECRMLSHSPMHQCVGEAAVEAAGSEVGHGKTLRWSHPI